MWHWRPHTLPGSDGETVQFQTTFPCIFRGPHGEPPGEAEPRPSSKMCKPLKAKCWRQRALLRDSGTKRSTPFLRKLVPQVFPLSAQSPFRYSRTPHGQVGGYPALPACGRQVGGEESRPSNHNYISRKPRPLGGKLHFTVFTGLSFFFSIIALFWSSKV